MDVKKVVGYGLSILGLLGLAASISAPVKEFLLGSLPEGLADGLGISLLVLSLIILAVGVVILFVTGNGRSGKVKQAKEEVPIYKGKEIVGYRMESK